MNESNENMIGGFESGWVHRFAADNSVSMIKVLEFERIRYMKFGEVIIFVSV